MDLDPSRAEISFTTPILLAIPVLVVAALLASRLLAPQRDPREPPFIPHPVPYIGHLLTFLREGGDYFPRLYQRYHHGIFAIPVFSSRIYVLATPAWAQAMHKNFKTLSFNTLIVQAMKMVFDMDEASMNTISRNPNGEDGTREGILLEMHDLMFTSFVQSIDEMNANFLKCWAPHINPLATHGKTETISLWYWLRHHFSIASTDSLYGPQNPLALNPGLEDDVWVFDDNIDKFFLPFPSLTLRKGYQARQRMFDAFVKFAENDGYKHASRIISVRAEVNYKHGISTRMVGYGETSMMFAVLINTVPVTFWLLSYLFADTTLLADVRAEIEACISNTDVSKRIVNVTKLKTQCPLLNSAMRETLRICATMNINRYVTVDTTLTNASEGESYLLKKGNLVMVGANVMHFEPDIFGTDPQRFDARRFLPTLEKGKNDNASGEYTGKALDPAAAYRDGEGKVHGGAFRPFGGGNNICPGRHFAQTEILTVVAMFVAGFDITAADGGKYVPPPFQATKIIAGVVRPARDVEVRVRRRPGVEDVEWVCEM
ncbi:hypothetical protein BAUCODRAFT_210021 [Baudoinia panamericana UAMH 10762]|uniref:Cytochrome P450 n=1 Tax=Baudoinia panamericana (strain UAMH 10762) TaxID=717646 RepID=M2N4T6_BAUPA|nr:uncharacterized protein BAUCODRAFT_210021 [Baudoinia panamericana UAMH 10762]EMC93770.1 hypothetical protein BAUCODRAFT_210021 [Baudoinia panamericana UAMH 10762]